MLRIAILGAGISGLATGWFLKQFLGAHIELTIIEKAQRPGGWIETVQKEGFLFEQGPRSCRTKGVGRETLALIEALGLHDQVIMPHPNAKNRYLYQGKGLQRLPKHVWEIPFNPLTQGWLKVLWRDWRMPKRQEKDESIDAFFFRRLGTSWTKNLIDPFVSGIYAGDTSRLSLKSCFPLFDEWEQQQGSLLWGALRHRSIPSKQSSFVQNMRHFPMFSFREGMETLPRALALALKDCLWLGQAVNGLTCERSKVKIELAGGQNLTFDHLISTLPTFALIPLLKDYPSLSAKMGKLSYATVTSINVGFRQAVLPYQGFGYLIPSRYGLQVLGCVWDSCVFPQQNRENQTRLTIMMGGQRHPEVNAMSDTELMEQTQQILNEHLKIKADPEIMQIKRAQQAIPQFEVGYAEWKQEIQEIMQQLPQVTLSGSAWTGVAINDCIAKGRQIAQSISSRN
jgi:oxygen-dependent protoporphyrinogen oxidase